MDLDNVRLTYFMPRIRCQNLISTTYLELSPRTLRRPAARPKHPKTSSGVSSNAYCTAMPGRKSHLHSTDCPGPHLVQMVGGQAFPLLLLHGAREHMHLNTMDGEATQKMPMMGSSTSDTSVSSQAHGLQLAGHRIKRSLLHGTTGGFWHLRRHLNVKRPYSIASEKCRGHHGQRPERVTLVHRVM